MEHRFMIRRGDEFPKTELDFHSADTASLNQGPPPFSAAIAYSFIVIRHRAEGALVSAVLVL
jgi:hypothetical protein